MKCGVLTLDADAPQFIDFSKGHFSEPAPTSRKAAFTRSSARVDILASPDALQELSNMIRPTQAPPATAPPSHRRSQDGRAAARQQSADAAPPPPRQASVPAKPAFSDDDVPRSVSPAVGRADSAAKRANTPAAAFEAAINRAPPASIASSSPITSPPAEFQSSNRYSAAPTSAPFVTAVPTSTSRKGSQYVSAGAFKAASRMSQTPPMPEAKPSASSVPNVSSGARPDSGSKQTERSEPRWKTESPAPPRQDEEDPLVAALRDLRDPSKAPPRPAPTGGVGLPGMTQSGALDYTVRRTATTSRYSQDQAEPSYVRSPTSSLPRSTSPLPVAAMMQPPTPAADPTSNVVQEYGQMFPGERRASFSRRNSTASQASGHGATGSVGRAAGFAGVGANGRSASPQPFNQQARSPSPYNQPQRAASPYDKQPSQRAQSPYGQQDAPLRASSPYGQQAPPQRAPSPYHNSPSRTTSPYGAQQSSKQPPRTTTPLGIALDASGQVTHDQLADEYRASMQRQQQQAQQAQAFAQPPPVSQPFQQATYPYQHQAYQQQAQPPSVVSPPPAQQQQQSMYGQAGWQAVRALRIHELRAAR
jgi:hypothetical protein